MYRPAILAAGVLAVAAVGFQTSTAYGEHSWGNYHWERTANPKKLNVEDNLSGKWPPYLVTARDEWNEKTTYVQGILTTITKDGKSSRNCKATPGRVEVCNAKYGFNGWLGLAQIWISGDHITQGVAKLNDSYFSSSTYNKPAWRTLVMCQEVAHTFGLSHQDEDFSNGNLGSCMDYTSNPLGPPSNESPNDHDYQQLETIYKLLDGSSAAITMKSPRGFQFAAYVRDDPEKDWGRAVAFTSKGQPFLFVKDLGQGNKRITHVLWTEDARRGQHFDDLAE